MKTPQIFILLGRSGCGKGTQAKLLQEKFGLNYISSGDFLRERIKTCDFTGKKMERMMKTGFFVPTPIIMNILLDILEGYKKDKQNLKGIIFDGVPRKLIEAQVLDQALEWYEWDKNTRVLLIDISETEAFNRLTKRRICQNCGKLIPYIGHYKDITKCDDCGGELVMRPDDKEEAIKSRLNEFSDKTEPVVDYYEKQGRLIRINGEQSIEDVHREILEKIN
ncbi:nucleoside monophosphate kinase [Patescibacteria group bacterium]|nr:nucleoside monophosphate kinase [Patescibacteria group bacterium]